MAARRSSLVSNGATDRKRWSTVKLWKLELPKDNATRADDDDDDDEKHSEKRTEVLEKIMEKKQNVKDLETYQTYQDFANKYHTDVKVCMMKERSTSFSKGTLLHEVMRQSRRNAEWWLWAKLILDVAKSLRLQILKVTSNIGLTCLHEAIEDEQLDFIEFICNVADDEELCDAIAAKVRGGNCIHLAITHIAKANPLPLAIVDQLTLKAAPSTIMEQRTLMESPGNTAEQRNTCLHDLVHIKLCMAFVPRCPRQQENCDKCRPQIATSNKYHTDYLNVLRRMIERCPDAMMKMNEAKQPPFLFHASTRSDTTGTKHWNGIDMYPAGESSMEAGTDRPEAKATAQLDSRKVHKSGIKAVGENSNADRIGKEGSANVDNHEEKHPPNKRDYSKRLAMDVFNLLMEACLSQKGFPAVCDSLFGAKYPSSEIMFKAAPLTAKTMDVHKGLPLEPIIACVELSLDDATSFLLEDVHLAQHLARGISEMRDARKEREERAEQFFEWLRKRNVKRIVKLVVYDSPSMPCRDTVIRSCLKGFDIRYLDWDKEDLCIQPLAKEGIAPNLQELWLKWSGRNSTLLGWSNKMGGLEGLEKLERVFLSINYEREDLNTTKRNFEEFRNAFTINSERLIDIKDLWESEYGFGHQTNQAKTPGEPKQGNLWLEAVDKFNKALTDFHKNLMNNIDEMWDHRIRDMVTVAIIDDGVDLEDLRTSKYIKGGWFTDRKESGRRPMNSWYISEKKHGTEMAKLVQRVCPFVSLYVGKLDTNRLVYKSVAASAAKAIRKAVAEGAKVISMSWTIYQTQEAGDNAEGLNQLKRAIEYAGTKDVIMFCASEDKGFSGNEQPYPATDCDTNILKCVGSAGTYGERAAYVKPGRIDYLLPGEIVKAPTKPSTGPEIVTGSSAATALAAGLAGLILWCDALQTLLAARKGTSHSPSGPGNSLARVASTVNMAGKAGSMQPPPPKPPSSFQTHKRMYGLFESLKSSTDNPFVNVEPILHKAVNSGDPPARLMELCRAKIPDLF